MSETSLNRRTSKEGTKHPKIMVAALGAAVLSAVGVTQIRANQAPETPSLNGPTKVYVAKPGDSEWSIGTKAYPGLDPREAQNFIDKQNPNQNHLVTPGQEFVFGSDAEIGKLVNNSPEAGSAPTG